MCPIRLFVFNYSMVAHGFGNTQFLSFSSYKPWNPPKVKISLSLQSTLTHVLFLLLLCVLIIQMLLLVSLFPLLPWAPLAKISLPVLLSSPACLCTFSPSLHPQLISRWSSGNTSHPHHNNLALIPALATGFSWHSPTLSSQTEFKEILYLLLMSVCAAFGCSCLRNPTD